MKKYVFVVFSKFSFIPIQFLFVQPCIFVNNIFALQYILKKGPLFL